MAEDALPITNDDDCDVALGMIYIDDYALFNNVINGQNHILSLVKKEKTGPPYWLKVTPTQDEPASPTQDFLRGYKEGYCDADSGFEERFPVSSEVDDVRTNAASRESPE